MIATRPALRFHRTGAAVLAVALVLLAATVEAQEWFPRLDYRLEGAYAASRDSRFNWIFDFAGDVEVVRGGAGRAVFVAEYEAVAGEQFRRFDVNQGNYLLEGVLLFRVAGLELGPVWHHVSRHLSDRPKRFPIDWNMIALRARDEEALGRLGVRWQADVRKTVTKAFVDYSWELESAAGLAYRATDRWDLVAAGSWRAVGTDDSRARGAQLAAHVETGVRMNGSAGSAELFVGLERRLDPYPIEFGTASWFIAGLRLASR